MGEKFIQQRVKFTLLIPAGIGSKNRDSTIADQRIFMAQEDRIVIKVRIPDIGYPALSGDLLGKGVGILGVLSRQTCNAIVYVHVK